MIKPFHLIVLFLRNGSVLADITVLATINATTTSRGDFFDHFFEGLESPFEKPLKVTSIVVQGKQTYWIYPALLLLLLFRQNNVLIITLTPSIQETESSHMTCMQTLFYVLYCVIIHNHNEPIACYGQGKIMKFILYTSYRPPICWSSYITGVALKSCLFISSNIR